MAASEALATRCEAEKLLLLRFPTIHVDVHRIENIKILLLRDCLWLAVESVIKFFVNILSRHKYTVV